MHIYIDESGTFSGAKEGTISVVGALIVPDTFLSKFNQRYEQVRRGLPVVDGEVKGRGLNEQQVAKVTKVARRHLALFEATVIDAGLHTQEGIAAYQNGLIDHLSALLPRLNQDSRPKVAAGIEQLGKVPAQLFLQAVATFGLMERILHHAPLFYVQRYPRELGGFTWKVDGKDTLKTTEWEEWWSQHAPGVLSLRSKLRPGPELEGADYSHMRKFETYDALSGSNQTDLALLLRDFEFASGYEPGLEVVDILTNAVRRALTNRLRREGWADIPSLMIARHSHYLDFIYLEGAGKAPKSPSYAPVVRAFSVGGRSMVSPSTHRKAASEAA